MNEIDDKRTAWMDISKGIAIILMVLGHSSLPVVLTNFIYAFHMPLFFIASGWTTNWQKYTLVGFLKKRTRSLIIPFLLYSAIILFIHVVYDWMTPSEWLQKGWSDGYPLWFIPVLFFASIIARCVYTLRNYKNGIPFWFFVILSLFAGIDLSHYHIRLPWAFSTIPYASFLIILGSEGKHLYEVGMHKSNIFVGLAMAFIAFAISFFWRLDLCFNSILPVFPLTIGAIAGTYMVFVFSRILNGKKRAIFNSISRLLQTVGREAYIIVAFSAIIIMLINFYVSIVPIIKYLILAGLMVVLSWLKKKVVLLWQLLIQ